MSDTGQLKRKVEFSVDDSEPEFLPFVFNNTVDNKAPLDKTPDFVSGGYVGNSCTSGHNGQSSIPPCPCLDSPDQTDHATQTRSEFRVSLPHDWKSFFHSEAALAHRGSHLLRMHIKSAPGEDQHYVTQ